MLTTECCNNSEFYGAYYHFAPCYEMMTFYVYMFVNEYKYDALAPRSQRRILFFFRAKAISLLSVSVNLPNCLEGMDSIENNNSAIFAYTISTKF